MWTQIECPLSIIFSQMICRKIIHLDRQDHLCSIDNTPMMVVALFQTLSLINQILTMTPQKITSRMLEASQQMEAREQEEGSRYS